MKISNGGVTMRVEIKIGLLLYAISVIISRFGSFGFFPINASEFLTGLFTAGGILLLFIGMIPEKMYNGLLYRKLVANKTDKGA